MKNSYSALATALLCIVLAGWGCGPQNSWTKISGQYYDWTKTGKPEHPYNHQYHQTLVYKILLGGIKQTLLTFEQSLEVMEKIDNLTRGIPKISYLVNWEQHWDGCRYPAWWPVNPRFKRPEDKTALESLRWLFKQGRKYNTTVSLHINMLDAWPESPLWDTYIKEDLLAREKDGSLVKYKFGYPISYTREWQAGYAQKRIDRLCEMLPLKKAGTVHIDAFHNFIPFKPKGPISPWHGISIEQETATQRKIFRYWRNKGVDVTSEFLDAYRIDPFFGLQPMTWHLPPSEHNYMRHPAWLQCGGHDKSEMGKLFGTSMYGEPLIISDPKTLKNFLRRFCLQTLGWYYLNRYDKISYLGKQNPKEVQFSDGIVTRLFNDGRFIMKHGNRLMRENDDVFIPALWRKNKEIIAYSAAGYEQKKWQLPCDWKKVHRVDIYEITLAGPKKIGEKIVDDRWLTLSLKKDQGVSIVPTGKPIEL